MNIKIIKRRKFLINSVNKIQNVNVIPENDIYGVTAIDGMPVVSSRKVAEVFDREHKHVLDAINTHIKRGKEDNLVADFSAANFKPSTYKDRGKNYPEFLLTKDGFIFVVMAFTGNKAAKFKITYINRFNEMERFIYNRNIAHLEYPELTNMIKLMHNEPKFYHFSNEADMINKIVLGMTAKQFREKRGLVKGESIRDYLNPWQTEAIQRLQKADVGLVVAIPDFQQRKIALQAYFDKLYGMLMLPVANY